MELADQAVRQRDPFLVVGRIGLSKVQECDLQTLGGGVERGGTLAQRAEVEAVTERVERRHDPLLDGASERGGVDWRQWCGAEAREDW